jgi:hypothetical protein
MNPTLPVIHAQTLEEATAIGLLPQRIAAWIAGSVGSAGLLLSALGLYGLAAFSVVQRTRELALRMAADERGLPENPKGVAKIASQSHGAIGLVDLGNSLENFRL